MERVNVVGGGLAGSECAWQLAKRGIPVRLFEMRPQTTTPAHTTGYLAELVCSNSLGSLQETTGSGLLKKELELLDSLILKLAMENRVPAGNALAVDRQGFAEHVSKTLENCPSITIVQERVSRIPPDEITILATGPLTDAGLQEAIASYTGEAGLFFFDAAAPLVEGESIDMTRVFWGSRYQDTGDYINCPMNEEEYKAFYEALLQARVVPLHDFESRHLFEGCLPIEELARRGYQTLLYGPLKPVGLKDSEGKRPFAVVQLRQDNQQGTIFNMVGFQTRLAWPEQARVFRMIPGLEKASFSRFGVMHRNTFIDSPHLLLPTLQYKDRATLFFAGQITGVEGYLESALSGLWAGLNAARLVQGKDLLIPPEETGSGGILRYITEPKNDFQPVALNFGFLPPVKIKGGKKKRRQVQVQRAVEALRTYLDQAGELRISL